jgi:hypothetical protein
VVDAGLRDHPSLLWKKKRIERIMEACVILYSMMIVEDEKEMVKFPNDLNDHMVDHQLLWWWPKFL